MNCSDLQRERGSYWGDVRLWQWVVEGSLMTWWQQLAGQWSRTAERRPDSTSCRVQTTHLLVRSSRRSTRSSCASCRQGIRRRDDLCSCRELVRSWAERDSAARSRGHWRWHVVPVVRRAATAVHWIHTASTTAELGCEQAPTTTPIPHMNGRLPLLHIQNRTRTLTRSSKNKYRPPLTLIRANTRSINRLWFNTTVCNQGRIGLYWHSVYWISVTKSLVYSLFKWICRWAKAYLVIITKLITPTTLQENSQLSKQHTMQVIWNELFFVGCVHYYSLINSPFMHM